MRKAESLGVGLRSGGARTGPLSMRDLKALGLNDLASQLSKKAGRDVNLYDLWFDTLSNKSSPKHYFTEVIEVAAYDLYGFKGVNIFEAKLKIEGKLNFSFEEGESAYQGGVYYKFGEKESESFVLKGNLDPFDGGAVEQKFSDYPILLYVDMTLRSEEIKFLLSKEFCLLRSEFFD